MILFQHCQYQRVRILVDSEICLLSNMPDLGGDSWALLAGCRNLRWGIAATIVAVVALKLVFNPAVSPQVN
jgi:hypothetical protein